jgi:NitT/TauT family transport system substrate-binding protein
VADPTFVAIAREKGDKSGRIIASIIDGVPFWGVTRKKISIKKISDLSNLRVATYPAPSTNYALMNRLIKEHRLNTRIVQGAFGTLLAIMERGRADMAMELEPTTSLAVRQGYQVVFSYKNLYGDFALTGLSTTNSFINSHPDICQKVVQALQKAYKFAYHDLKGAIEVANKQFPDIDKDAVQMGVKRMIEDKIIPRSVVVKEKSWNEAISLRRHIGDLKSNAPFSENVDNQFSEIAVQSVSE